MGSSSSIGTLSRTRRLKSNPRAACRCSAALFRCTVNQTRTVLVTIASDLLQRHFQTLVADNAQWETLISDNVVWELPFAVALGHPSKLSGRDEVVRHANWFLGAVDNFRFFDL